MIVAGIVLGSAEVFICGIYLVLACLSLSAIFRCDDVCSGGCWRVLPGRCRHQVKR
jgi:hypothetical protein